jgi:hypothetical protein
MMVSGKNRIMISGPKADDTYVVTRGLASGKFRTIQIFGTWGVTEAGTENQHARRLAF